MKIFDIYYKSDRKVYLDLLENEVVTSVPLESYKFNFVLSNEKFCPGYFQSGEYHKCIRNNTIGDKVVLCDDCERAIGFKSAFFMNATPNESMNEYLKKKHFLYLAYFEPGILKVGTANIDRGETRLLEQDAQFYSFIDSADGFEIPEKEKEASIKLNLTTSVKSVHKSKYLGIKPNPENVIKIFESKFDILDIPEKPQVEDLTSAYFYPEDYTIISDNLNLVGTFQGLRGRYLIIENTPQSGPFGGYKAFDINYIIGRTITGYLDEYEYLTEPTLFG